LLFRNTFINVADCLQFLVAESPKDFAAARPSIKLNRGSPKTNKKPTHKTSATSSMEAFSTSSDRLLALIPLSVPLILSLNIIITRRDGTSQQLLAYMTMAVIGYVATLKLVPNIQQYTLRKGICGKDLGKKGTPRSEVPM